MQKTFHSLGVADLEIAAQPMPWIWDGFIGQGKITLFISPPKLGKTTLLTHLLAKRRCGGELLAHAVAVGCSAVISEEGAPAWHERNVQFGFHPGARFFCRPFLGPPTQQLWLDLLDHLRGLHDSIGLDLVIFDPISHFLPRHEENHAGLVINALEPVRALADAGLAVVMVHHPRKAPAPEGMASRGSTQMTAFVDVIVEMYPITPEATDRRRRLAAFSRDPATPRTLLFELKENGAGYEHLAPPPADAEFMQQWMILRIVLEDARKELTRQDIAEQWPSTYPRPSDSKLYRVLCEACKRAWIKHAGTGHCADPFRYYLPQKMASWQDDPMFTIGQRMREAREFTAKFQQGYDVTG